MCVLLTQNIPMLLLLLLLLRLAFHLHLRWGSEIS
jgi:hypothetical protein